MLYLKGGKLSKAVEMCFAAQLFEVGWGVRATPHMRPMNLLQPLCCATSPPARSCTWARPALRTCCSQPIVPPR